MTGSVAAHSHDILLTSGAKSTTSEKAVLECQQKFEGLFKHNPEAAAYVGPDYRILDINPRFVDLFGYSLKEIRGKSLLETIVPEDRKEEGKKLDENAKEGYVHCDTVRKRKDGSLVPMSVSAAPIIVDGKLMGYMGTYQDISELKKAEEALKASNEKLRVVGSLTRHDIRNKLAGLNGYIFLLRKKLNNDDEALRNLKEMELVSNQILRILEFLRFYEQLGAEKLTNMDIEKCISEAASLFSDLSKVRIVNECHGLSVQADSLLTQVFYNLIDNSLKHGEKVTEIKICCRSDGANLLDLIYEDDGVGVPEEMRANLFKEGHGRGTGYGLYLTKKICETYGWKVRETGKHGEGARFVMTMPKAAQNHELRINQHLRLQDH